MLNKIKLYAFAYKIELIINLYAFRYNYLKPPYFFTHWRRVHYGTEVDIAKGKGKPGVEVIHAKKLDQMLIEKAVLHAELDILTYLLGEGNKDFLLNKV